MSFLGGESRGFLGREAGGGAREKSHTRVVAIRAYSMQHAGADMMSEQFQICCVVLLHLYEQRHLLPTRAHTQDTSAHITRAPAANINTSNTPCLPILTHRHVSHPVGIEHFYYCLRPPHPSSPSTTAPPPSLFLPRPLHTSCDSPRALRILAIFRCPLAQPGQAARHAAQPASAASRFPGGVHTDSRDTRRD